jgi:hypothetical protein
MAIKTFGQLIDSEGFETYCELLGGIAMNTMDFLMDCQTFLSMLFHCELVDMKTFYSIQLDIEERLV